MTSMRIQLPLQSEHHVYVQVSSKHETIVAMKVLD